MLVHICHNSMSFTHKMHNHKGPQTDAGGTGQQGDAVHHQLCGSYPTAGHCEIVTGAFYTGPLAGSDLG